MSEQGAGAASADMKRSLSLKAEMLSGKIRAGVLQGLCGKMSPSKENSDLW